jgi:cellulose synthase/poly-beta-1,6-N-acetylglucosamine synthase-like glycosyltransferase
MANPPLIFPLQEETSPRPFWSVMILTHNPRADYLAETLLSVLKQDAGPEQMQIEVVDDGSMHDAVSEVVRRVGAGLSRSCPVLLQFGAFLILRARVAGAQV